MTRIPAPEESKLHVEWFKEAEKCTLENVGDFIKKLMTDYELDYGSVVHAITAGVGATISAMNNSEQGGITGFQASCLMWEILQKEFNIEWPTKLVKYENMLFPVYEQQFNTIPHEIWSWLRDRAQYLLDNEPGLDDSVKKHMKTVADGIVPFGYRISTNND